MIFEIVTGIGGSMAAMNSFKFGSFGFFFNLMSGVMKGLCFREEHVMVLSGACLSSVVDSTELKRSR